MERHIDAPGCDDFPTPERTETMAGARSRDTVGIILHECYQEGVPCSGDCK